MIQSEALGWLERGLTIIQGEPSRLCQTGEPYITFTQGGPRSEGESSGGGNDTSDLAIRFWLKHVLVYKNEQLNQGKDVLYWRTPLEVEEQDGKWFAYGRFVITDKEVK